MIQIFEKLCKDNEYELSDSARAVLKIGFTKICGAKSQNFSNGRLVRKVFERTRIKQAFRASDNTITEQDIQEAFAERDIAALFGNNRKAIGFQIPA